MNICLELAAKVFPLQVEVLLVAEESFTQHDEAHNVEDGIGRKVMELLIVEMLQTLQKYELETPTHE